MWARHHDLFNDDRLEHVEYPASDMVELEQAVRASEYIPAHEKDRWVTSLKAGGEDVLIALALTLLPNLGSMELQPFRDSNSSIVMTINSIAEAKHSGGPLAKLNSVTIGALPESNLDFLDEEPLNDPSFVEAFAMLPSVKIINAERFCGDSEKLEDIVPMIQSNVTDLNIWDSDVSPYRLMLLLQSFKSLQSFTYSPDRDYGFDAFSIVANLLLCAQDSLRELEVRARSANPEYMGSLRNLRVLENLDTDTKLLFGGSESLVQNFQTSLPASIRGVKLHGNHRNHQALSLHLNSLTKARNLLPNLSSIELFETMMPELEAARLQEMCATVNISLKIRDYGHDSTPTFVRHRSSYAERQAKKAQIKCEVLDRRLVSIEVISEQSFRYRSSL